VVLVVDCGELDPPCGVAGVLGDVDEAVVVDEIVEEARELPFAGRGSGLTEPNP